GSRAGAIFGAAGGLAGRGPVLSQPAGHAPGTVVAPGRSPDSAAGGPTGRGGAAPSAGLYGGGGSPADGTQQGSRRGAALPRPQKAARTIGFGPSRLLDERTECCGGLGLPRRGCTPQLQGRASAS